MDTICFLCNKGCRIRAVDEDHLVGAECQKGVDFAQNELSHPMRTLTTTVKTSFPSLPVVSVRTDAPVRKADVFRIMKALNTVVVNDVKQMGDVIVPNILNLGVNVILTTNMTRRIR